MRPFLFTAPSSSGACYSSEISRVVLYERHDRIIRFKQTLQRHEGGFASGICQVHCFQNSLAWDVYSKSWPPFSLLLCLLSLPSRSHSNWCSACSGSRTRQPKRPWPAWLGDLWPGCSNSVTSVSKSQTLPQPMWVCCPKHSSCPHHPICARDLVALAPKF